jgi:hypothetical protein
MRDILNNKEKGSRGDFLHFNRRGQLTMFIILAIVIVAVIVIVFVVRPDFVIRLGGPLNFDECISDTVDGAIVELARSGGFRRPIISQEYKGEVVPIFCTTEDFYTLCTVQVPFPQRSFEKELSGIVSGAVQECYDQKLDDLISQGLNVSGGKVSSNLSIGPSSVRVVVNAPTAVEGQSFLTMTTEVQSNIYQVLMIATSILGSESSLGDSDIDTLMLLYPEYIITKDKLSDGTTVYVIREINSEIVYKFASRSLVWPSGFDR